MHSKLCRVALLSFIFAAAGFSYAIATAPESRDVASSRAKLPAAVQLTFANPFVTATLDRDLGDAVPGKTFKRFVRAKGGIPPYRFTAGSLDPALLLGRGGFFSTPLVNKVRAALPPTFPVGPYRFMTTVTERGTSDTRSEPFRLSVVADTRFRFALGPGLSDATQFRNYADHLAIINPNAPLTYQLVGQVFLDGVAQPSLASLGLALCKTDGVIFGQPLKAGLITFTATVTDAAGNVGLSRDGTTASQTFSIKVDPNKVVASEAFCQGLKVKVGKSAGTGTLQYSGVINLGGALSSLSGKPVQLRIGNFVSPEAVFGTDGTATNLNGKNKKGVSGQPVITAKVNGNGTLVITVKNASFAVTDLLEDNHVNHAGLRATLPDDIITGRTGIVGGIVGDSSIEQAVPVSSSSSSSLALSSESGTPAGGFLALNTISGHDDKTQLGDKWRVTFMGTPPSGTDLTPSTSILVGIGNLSSALPATVSGTNIKGSVKVDSTTRNTVTRFTYSTKSQKGSYTTTYLDATATGIPISGASSTQNPNYTTQLVFRDTAGNSILSSEASQTLFPKKNAWTSTAPK
jgi:hypothetical protein